MKTVTNFEDLRCWKNARKLCTDIYLLESDLLARDFGTRDQLRRATLSIMNNIAEGFARYSNKETARFLDIAQSSAAEVLSMLYVLEDIEYVKPAVVADLKAQTLFTRHQILAFIKSLR